MPELKFGEHKTGQLAGQLEGQFEGIVVVLGANGAGKTTFLKALHGIGAQTAYWDGQKAVDTKSKRAFVSQSPELLKGSAEYNLKMACKLLSMPKDLAEKRIDKVIQNNDLSAFRNRSTAQLSGGEQARLCFARACLNEPDVMLLDEITAHLDPENTKRLEIAMKSIAQNGTIFFVTHIISQARRLANHVIFLDHGNILYSGSAKDFFGQKQDERIAKFLAGELL